MLGKAVAHEFGYGFLCEVAEQPQGEVTQGEGLDRLAHVRCLA
jgi:hypothetical protein